MLTTLSRQGPTGALRACSVDVQNDFAADGGAMHREGRDVSWPGDGAASGAAGGGGAGRKGRMIWIRNVYNTGPNWYLSEVWLEQASAGATAHIVDYPGLRAEAWNGDFYQIRPKPDEVIVTKHRYGAFESSDLDLVLALAGASAP